MGGILQNEKRSRWNYYRKTMYMSSRIWTEVHIFILGRRQQLLRQGKKIWYGFATFKTQWFPKLFLVPVQPAITCPCCSVILFQACLSLKRGLSWQRRAFVSQILHPKNQPLNAWFSQLLQRIFRDGSCRGSESVYLPSVLCYRRVVILMDVNVLQTADQVAGPIGNPQPYNEGEYL